MIFTRYLYREILGTAAALLLLVVLIYLSQRFIQFLGEANSGGLPMEFMFKLLALKLLWVLIILVPLAFFLAILLVLGRLHAENEMVAMYACGVGLPFLLQRILGLALGVALGMGILSFYLAPWSERQQENIRYEIRQLAEVAGLSAGRFQAFDGNQGVFYVESLDKTDMSMRNLFVALERPDKTALVTANRAYQLFENQTEARYIVLFDGYRYDVKPGTAALTSTRFDHHAVLINPPNNRRHYYYKAVETRQLWGAHEPGAVAELQLRLSAPLAVLLLAPLAVLMSHSSPRQSTYPRILSAVLLYFIYSNGLEIAQKWIEREYIPGWLGVWWLHLLLLLLLLILFRRQQRY